MKHLSHALIIITCLSVMLSHGILVVLGSWQIPENTPQWYVFSGKSGYKTTIWILENVLCEMKKN